MPNNNAMSNDTTKEGVVIDVTPEQEAPAETNSHTPVEEPSAAKPASGC